MFQVKNFQETTESKKKREFSSLIHGKNTAIPIRFEF